MSVKFERDSVQETQAPGDRQSRVAFSQKTTQQQQTTTTKNGAETKAKPGYLAVRDPRAIALCVPRG